MGKRSRGGTQMGISKCNRAIGCSYITQAGVRFTKTFNTIRDAIKTTDEYAKDKCYDLCYAKIYYRRGKGLIREYFIGECEYYPELSLKIRSGICAKLRRKAG